MLRVREGNVCNMVRFPPFYMSMKHTGTTLITIAHNNERLLRVSRYQAWMEGA